MEQNKQLLTMLEVRQKLREARLIRLTTVNAPQIIINKEIELIERGKQEILTLQQQLKELDNETE